MSGTFAYFFSTPLVDEERNALSMIDVSKEMRELEAVYEDSNAARGEIKFVSSVATPSDFTKVLSTYRPNVLHFSGHGDRDGNCMFENEMGVVRRIGAYEFAELLRHFGSLDLIFLSSCYSEKLARELVQQKCCKVVVAVNTDHAVLDKVSMRFTTSFYASLFNGFSIEWSFEIARARVKLDMTSGNFVKLTSNSDAGKITVTSRKRHSDGEVFDIIRASSNCLNRCDSPLQNVIGRSRELQQLVQMLNSRGIRSVACIGEPGIGVTSVVLSCAKFISERNMFDDVYFINLDREEGSLRDLICKILTLSDSYSTDAEMMTRFKERYVSQKILLVIDGCDTSKKNIDSKICRVLEGMGVTLFLGIRHVETTRIDVPHIKMDEGLAKRSVRIERLSDENIALLFLRASPRNLTLSELQYLSEMKLNDLKSFDDVVMSFSTSKIVCSLRGSASVAVRVASYINASVDLTKEKFEKEIIEKIVPRISKQVQNRSTSKSGRRDRLRRIMSVYLKEKEELRCAVNEFVQIWKEDSVCDWSLVKFHLLKDFKTCFPERPLNHKDLDTLYSYSISHSKTGPFRFFQRDNSFCVKTLADFFARWWIPFKQSMSILKSSWIAKPYNSNGEPLGSLIEGFLRNSEVTTLLKERSVGTFLVRFSFSQPGWLVVEYLIKGKVATQKRRATVEVHNIKGATRFVLPIKKGLKFEKETLPDLLSAVSLFKYLHPDRPKNQILSSRHHHHKKKKRRRPRVKKEDGKRGMAWGVT